MLCFFTAFKKNGREYFILDFIEVYQYKNS